MASQPEAIGASRFRVVHQQARGFCGRMLLAWPQLWKELNAEDEREAVAREDCLQQGAGPAGDALIAIAGLDGSSDLGMRSG